MVEDLTVTRLAVISDTHLPRGARVLPAACLEQLRAADAILHAGDLIELSVLAELERSGRRCTPSAGTSTRPSCRRGCR